MDPQPMSLGKRLRRERESQHWTQEQLAEKIKGSVPSINRWEHDRVIPRADMINVLTQVFRKPPERWGIGRQIIWNVPFARNPYFTGRERVLMRLHQALTAEQTVALSQARAISGLGGIGKTQTAIEYAYRYAEEYEAVLWVRADSLESLISDFAVLASLLDLREKDEADQNRIVFAIKRWLQDNDSWLLILDNADDLAQIFNFLPKRARGAILLTTRSQITGTHMKQIKLEQMSREEGVTFLLRRIASSEEDDGEEPLLKRASDVERHVAEEIWQVVDGLPLALDQAGAYIEETGCSLIDYLKFYQSRRKQLLHLRGQDAVGHPEPVATTWSLSFEKVKQANPASAELLYLLAFLHPDNIPESLIIKGAAKLGTVLQSVVKDEFDFNRAIGELHKYSLIKRDPEEKIIVIHRLVQAVVQDGMEEQERGQWMERTIAMLDTAFPELALVVTYEALKQCEYLLPHVLTCTVSPALCKPGLELASLLYKTARYLRERSQYEQAEIFFQRSSQLFEQLLGSEHPKVATSLCGLATQYVIKGKYKQAEPLYLRALQIFEQRGGSEYPEFAISLNGLAILYDEQGKYEQAESLYLHALQVRERTLGPQHPQVVISLNSVASFYAQQDKYEQAEPLFLRALQISVQALGPEHYEFALSYNNSAEFYYRQGKYEQAEPLYLRVLQIWEQALGPQHIQVGHPLGGLADLYREQGKYEQAEPLYLRVLQIWEQALESDHPYLGYPLNGLANLYREQGKYEQAEQLYLRALTIRQHHRGLQHPETAECLHDFARFHELRKQPEKAIALYLQALSIREQQLGLQHPRTINTRTRAVQLLRECGRLKEATELEATPTKQAMTSDQSIS